MAAIRKILLFFIKNRYLARSLIKSSDYFWGFIHPHTPRCHGPAKGMHTLLYLWPDWVQGVCANFHGKAEKYLRYNGIHIHYSKLSYFEMQEFEVQ